MRTAVACSRTGRLRVLVGIAVLLAGIATLASGGRVALANTPAAGLGINGWYLFWDTPESTWDAQVALMAADGIKVVRADAFWSDVEPDAPTAAGPGYNWSTTDAIAGTLAAHGLQWVPIIDYSAPWNESIVDDAQSAPTSAADYGTYAAAVVARYGPGGSFWTENPQLTPEPVTAVEIWNEPNEIWTEIDASTYAAMYAAARTDIDRIDPSVETIVGGLGNPSASYIDDVQQALGGPGQIDAVAVHPYGDNPSQVISNVVALRTALDQIDDGNVPIDVTEFGWPTEGVSTNASVVSDSVRAGYMTQVISQLATSDCGVERILPYAWSSAQQDALDGDDWFGVTNDGAATATSAAIAAEYQAIESAPEPTVAGNATCGRPLSLQLAVVAPSASSTSDFCVQATALTWGSQGWATIGISGATITFSAPSARTVVTGNGGVATACWTVAPGSTQTASALATDPQFSQTPGDSVTGQATGASSSKQASTSAPTQSSSATKSQTSTPTQSSPSTSTAKKQSNARKNSNARKKNSTAKKKSTPRKKSAAKKRTTKKTKPAKKKPRKPKKKANKQ